jgi:Porphyromonas-type peptidyl-arginine deiminase
MARLKSRQAGLSVPRASAPKADVRADATPAAVGYRMPAEWEPHKATWLAWPHERTDWPGKFAPIPWVYADIVRHLARVERVRILVQDRAEERVARRILQQSGADLAAVDFFVAPTNRGWTRDFGAIFVRKCTASAPPADVILSEAKNLSEVANVDREILRRCAPQNDTAWLFVAAENRIRAASERHSIELT